MNLRLAPGPHGRVLVLIASLSMLAAGCGTNLEEALFQTVSAAGRTFLDLALTDLANDVADSFEREESAPADQTGDDAGNDDGGMDEDDATDGSADGAALFAANCSACHGDDGASGFAPDISGFAADALTTGLALPTHDAITMTEDEVAAIAAFFANGGDGGATADGDPASGEQIFGASGCGACHCDDASGGCALDAPSLSGVAFDRLDEKLRGETAHTGGKFDLNDQDLMDLQAFLAGL